MSITEEIRQRIADDPRSIKELARDAGLNQPTLQRFASGQRDLTSELLGKLVAALGGEIEWKKIPKK